jgi:hypothetical protein
VEKGPDCPLGLSVPPLDGCHVSRAPWSRRCRRCGVSAGGHRLHGSSTVRPTVFDGSGW